MNHSIIICDSESYNNIDKNNDKIFVFNNSLESNNSLIYNIINYTLNNRAISTCNINFPFNLNPLFWQFLDLSRFLQWIGITVESNIPNSIYLQFSDNLSALDNKLGKSTLEYFQKPASEGKVLGRTPLGYIKDTNGGYKIYE